MKLPESKGEIPRTRYQQVNDSRNFERKHSFHDDEYENFSNRHDVRDSIDEGKHGNDKWTAVGLPKTAQSTVGLLQNNGKAAPASSVSSSSAGNFPMNHF